MEGKARLRKIRIDHQGYTREGVYFGVGMPLWQCSIEQDDPRFPTVSEVHTRAYDREHAKEKLLKLYPKLVFGR